MRNHTMASSIERVYLGLLQAAIRQNHHCEAIHQETVPVTEFVDGKVIWQGNVEVFELIGHEQARRCYSWMVPDKTKTIRYVSVLESLLINSPTAAVRSAIFTNKEFPQPPSDRFAA